MKQKAMLCDVDRLWFQNANFRQSWLSHKIILIARRGVTGLSWLHRRRVRMVDSHFDYLKIVFLIPQGRKVSMKTLNFYS